jgi:transcription elongation factor GreA
MQRMPVTPQGYQKLVEEIKHMKTVERPRCIQAIAEARSHGDLSENAEYDAAKHAQGLLEGRIKDFEARLSLAQVIDPAAHAGTEKIVFGATVEMEDTDEGRKVVYQIVGEVEADVKAGKISVTSPIARALVGREVGDTVVVQAPGGKREYEILAVKYV